MNRNRYGDIGVRVGALALATLVWFYAVTELPYRAPLSIPLQVEDPPTNPPGKIMIVANPTPRSVEAIVAGRGKDLLRMSADQFLLRLETPYGRPGRVLSFRLTPELVEKSTELSVSVEEILYPREVEVILDERIEKQVGVDALVRVEVAESYTQVGQVTVSPQVVTLVGPSAQVRSRAAVSTDSLVRTNVRQDITESLPLVVPEDTRILLSDSHVTVTVDVQELAEYDIANVPVQVTKAGSRSVMAEPSRVTVRVRGGADVIGKLDPETDIDLQVDFVDRSADGRVEVTAGKNAPFEVRQITPRWVTLVER